MTPTNRVDIRGSQRNQEDSRNQQSDAEDGVEPTENDAELFGIPTTELKQSQLRDFFVEKLEPSSGGDQNERSNTEDETGQSSGIDVVVHRDNIGVNSIEV